MDSESRKRYSRQISLPEVGEEGQERLCASTVAVVGCGALGSSVAMLLAGAGVGHIVVADFDTIDISNLQRQLFFETAQAGREKSEVLRERMLALNPGIAVTSIDRLITGELAKEVFSKCDFVVDATDNPASKKMVESVCKSLGKPCCIAGVAGFHGQIMTLVPGSAGFSELFPDTEDAGIAPCSIEGVIGPAASVCASLQASETIKYLTGAGETLAGKLLTFDLLDNNFQLFNL